MAIRINIDGKDFTIDAPAWATEDTLEQVASVLTARFGKGGKKLEKETENTAKNLEEVNKQAKERTEAEKKSTKAIDDRREAERKLRNELWDFKTNMSRFDMRGARDFPGTVDRLTESFGYLFPTVSKVATVFGFIIGIASQLGESFNKAANIGLSGFTGSLASAAASAKITGMEFAKFAELVKKTNGATNMLDAGINNNGQSFAQLVKNVQMASEMAGGFGLSTEQLGKVTAASTEMAVRSGLRGAQAAEAARTASISFAKQIDTLARTTGADKDKITETYAELAANTSMVTAAYMQQRRGLTLFRNNLNEVAIGLTQVFGPETGKKLGMDLADAVTLGVDPATISEGFQKLAVLAPDAYRSVNQMIAAGEKDMSKITAALGQNLRGLSDADVQIMTLLARQGDEGAKMILEARKNAMSIKEVNELNKASVSRGYRDYEQEQRLNRNLARAKGQFLSMLDALPFNEILRIAGLVVNVVGAVIKVFDLMLTPIKMVLDGLSSFGNWLDNLFPKVFGEEGLLGTGIRLGDMFAGLAVLLAPALIKMFAGLFATIAGSRIMSRIISPLASTFSTIKERIFGRIAGPGASAAGTAGGRIMDRVGGGIGSVGEGVGKAVGSVGQGIGQAGQGVGKAISGIAGGIGEATAKLLPAIGQGIAGFFTAFGNPAVLKGAVIGGAAIAAFVGLVGLGVGAALSVIGGGLALFNKGLEGFNKIDGKNLALVGEGLKGLGVGMIAFAGAMAGNAVGGAINAVAGLFGGDIMSRIKKTVAELVPILPQLQQVGPAMQAYGTGLKAFADALTSINVDQLSKVMGIVQNTKNIDVNALKNFSAAVKDSGIASLGQAQNQAMDQLATQFAMMNQRLAEIEANTKRAADETADHRRQAV